MNIYYNAEYTGAHEDSHLVSMGFITEDNQGLYLEFMDLPNYSINDYVRNEILPETYLYSNLYENIEQAAHIGEIECMRLDVKYQVTTHSTAVYAIKEWFGLLLATCRQGETLQLVSYCSHYDASLFYNLFQGEIPEYLNLICYDIVGLVMHYINDWDSDLPLSYRLRETLKNNHMDELAVTLGHPTREYTKNSAVKYAEVIKNVYEGLKESKRF